MVGSKVFKEPDLKGLKILGYRKKVKVTEFYSIEMKFFLILNLENFLKSDHPCEIRKLVKIL